MLGPRDKFGTDRKKDPDTEAGGEERLSAGGSGLRQGSKHEVRADRGFVYRLAAADRVEGEPGVVESGRQLDPAGTAAFRKGQIGVGDIDKYMRGLREGGVGVGIGAASSATEQAAPEWTGRGG